MFEKRKLKKAIAESEATIEDLEYKRNRSQAAILHATINKIEPPEADKEIFNLYTQLIDLERKHLVSLKDELEKLEQLQ